MCVIVGDLKRQSENESENDNEKHERQLDERKQKDCEAKRTKRHSETDNE